MRSELEQLEQIDQYLGGKMSPDQAAAFEAQMEADPALKSMVEDQQLLIKAVARKALMAEINTVAAIAGAGGAGAAAGWGLTQWVLTAVSIIGATVGGVYIYDAVTSDDAASTEQVVEAPIENQEEIAATLDTGEFMSFELAVDEDEVIEELTYEEAHGENLSATDQNNNGGIRHQGDPLNNFGKVDGIVDREDDSKPKVEFDDTETTIGNLQKNRKASFPGGAIARKNWFAKNLMYPGTAKKEKVQATVKVHFFVEPNGAISEVDAECFVLKDENGTILTGIKRTKHRKSIKAFERQAAAAFRKNPFWVPATNTHGTPIASEQLWYVNFVLNGKSSVYNFEDETGAMFQNHPSNNSDSKKNLKTSDMTKSQVDSTNVSFVTEFTSWGQEKRSKRKK